MTQPVQECDILFVEPAGGTLQSKAPIPEEGCILLRIDTENACYITCSPSDIVELVYGRLLTSGYIQDASDISSIQVNKDDCIVDVELADTSSFALRHTSSEAPTYGTVGNVCTSLERGTVELASGKEWSFDAIFGLARDFAADTPIHLATFGAHSCTLVSGDGRRYCCEDIGRHNAMDKAIGAAMMDGVDLSRALVFSSGRIPADMVSKVIRARIPVLVSKGVPTDLGVQIAKDAGLVLICAARPDSLKVFNKPE